MKIGRGSVDTSWPASAFCLLNPYLARPVDGLKFVDHTAMVK